jgi:hypothetical protein
MNREIVSGVPGLIDYKREARGVEFRGWAGALFGVALIIVALAVLIAGGGLVHTADAQTTQDPAISYKFGEVTANRGTTIQIDNQDYVLLDDAAITDDAGKPRDRKELVPGTDVKFHVSARRGGIDQIIMILPK